MAKRRKKAESFNYRSDLLSVCKRDPKVVLMLSYLLHIQAQVGVDRWFAKYTDEIRLATGLKWSAQDRARTILRRLGFIREQRIGIPALIHYQASARPKWLPRKHGKTKNRRAG